jgi:hypothetical protein
VTALGGIIGGPVGCSKSVGHRRFGACTSSQGGNSVEKLTAMPDKADAQILQVFRGQARQDGFVDSVLTESLLILFEAKAPQPTGKVHDEVLIPSQAWFGQLVLRDGGQQSRFSESIPNIGKNLR